MKERLKLKDTTSSKVFKRLHLRNKLKCDMCPPHKCENATHYKYGKNKRRKPGRK
jgi:hypothetical protein